MKRFQDIHIADQPLISSYINYFINENYNDAFNLLDNNPQLDNKKFIAEVLNTINNMIYTLEENYYEDVPDYLDELKDTLQLIIDNYKNMGDYQASVVYQKYNYVLYNNNYYLYINSNPSYNILPTNTTYWKLIGLIGDDGAPGYGLTLKYDWQSSANYQKYDVVYYDDYLWVAEYPNTNSTPQEGIIVQNVSLIIDQYVDSTDSSHNGVIVADSIDSNGILDTTNLDFINSTWETLCGFENASIQINSSQPADPYTGLIWFEIIQ